MRIRVCDFFCRIDQIYLVGNLPDDYHRKTRIHGGHYCQKYLYQLPNSVFDWYITGYIEYISPVFAEHHPFGPNFTMKKWNLDEPIDKWDMVPGKRVRLQMEIKYL